MGELGKNMFALQSGSEILLIDGGLAYAPTAMLGVEFLVPAADWLIENRQNIVAWILTHAHEDHIGGLPYLLRYLPRIPVFATNAYPRVSRKGPCGCWNGFVNRRP